jgi:hypothetical protein
MYFTLDLPVAKDLYAAFDAFTTGELMQGDNAWLNEATGTKENVIKRITIWNFPKILVVTLKRFINERRKDDSFVQYPVTGLDLSKYATGYDRKDNLYNLYGVACHIGNTQGGHYYAYIMNRETGKWYCYNDSSVTIVKNITEVVVPYAYCLFYYRDV